MKIFAFLPHATPLYVIHTNGYGVVVCVDHGAVGGVCKAAVGLSPGTVSSLELPADLGHGGREKSIRCSKKKKKKKMLSLSLNAGFFCHLQSTFDYPEPKSLESRANYDHFSFASPCLLR